MLMFQFYYWQHKQILSVYNLCPLILFLSYIYLYIIFLNILILILLYYFLKFIKSMSQYILNLPMAVQVNVPQKKNSSRHVQNLIAILFFYVSFALGVYFYLTNQFELEYFIIVICVGYLLNILISLCCNRTRQYMDNLKSFQEYEIVYNNMVNSRAHFTFYIECYHYQTKTQYHTHIDQHGRTHTQSRTYQEKVATHTAHEIINPKQSVDQSGELTSIYENKQLVFLHCIRKYYFIDENSAGVFQGLYNNFIQRNKSDSYQYHSYQLVIPGFVERISFYTRQKISSGGYYLSILLGVSYLYALINEQRVARYKISIVKRITM